MLQPIPAALLEAPTAAKYLYLYLAGRGELSLSSRTLARQLGLSQPTVCAAFGWLGDAGLLAFLEEPRERVKPVFRVLTEEEVRQKHPGGR